MLSYVTEPKAICTKPAVYAGANRPSTRRFALLAVVAAVVVALACSLAPASADTAYAASSRISIKQAVVTIKDQVFKGKAKTPNPKVVVNGIKLKKNRDYVVKYKKNARVGVATATIKGVGNYKGTIKAKFMMFAPKKGWQTISKKTYYLTNKKGKAAKGWKTIKGKRYYFDALTGAMQKGWLFLDGKIYYFNKKTGVLVTGWKKLNDKKYFFDLATGAAAVGETLIDGRGHRFLDDGSLYQVWRDEIGHWETTTYYDVIKRATGETIKTYTSRESAENKADEENANAITNALAANGAAVQITEDPYYVQQRDETSWVIDKEAGWYIVIPDYRDGYLYHQKQGNGKNCGATSFAVAVNILLRENKYLDNVAIWSSKAFNKDSTGLLNTKGTKWLEMNGLSSKMAIERVSGDIHYTSQMRAQLELGRMVIISSGSKSVWQHADGTQEVDGHGSGHWIVFYYYANGVYYANDSSKSPEKGAGCPYTEAQMQQWLDGRSSHAATVVYLK